MASASFCCGCAMMAKASMRIFSTTAVADISACRACVNAQNLSAEAWRCGVKQDLVRKLSWLFLPPSLTQNLPQRAAGFSSASDESKDSDYSRRFPDEFFFLRTSIRFHPKSRASTDHSPGPNKAKAIPMVARKMFAQGSPDCRNVFHTPSARTKEPGNGNH